MPLAISTLFPFIYTQTSRGLILGLFRSSRETPQNFCGVCICLDLSEADGSLNGVIEESNRRVPWIEFNEGNLYQQKPSRDGEIPKD